MLYPVTIREHFVPVLALLTVLCALGASACQPEPALSPTELRRQEMAREWEALLDRQPDACRDAALDLRDRRATESLSRLIVACKPQDLDALVPLLPVELRANAVLTYKSQDFRKTMVSPDRPGVTLFSDTGKLILSYVGPHSGEEPAIETMEFDDTQARFELARLTLGPEVRRESESCARCHGEDPQPIWGSYPFWPGHYGSQNDTLIASSPQEASYRRFVEQVAPTSARYGALDLTRKNPSKFPWDGPFAQSPNRRLTRALAPLLAERAARILLEVPANLALLREHGNRTDVCGLPDVDFSPGAVYSHYYKDEFDEEERLISSESAFEGIASPRPRDQGHKPVFVPDFSKTPKSGVTVYATWRRLEAELVERPDSLLFLAGHGRRRHFFEQGGRLEDSIECLTRRSLGRRLGRR